MTTSLQLARCTLQALIDFFRLSIPLIRDQQPVGRVLSVRAVRGCSVRRGWHQYQLLVVGKTREALKTVLQKRFQTVPGGQHHILIHMVFAVDVLAARNDRVIRCEGTVSHIVQQLQTATWSADNSLFNAASSLTTATTAVSPRSPAKAGSTQR
jgi:hypothetical protein